jgi:hypothetical protein
MMFEPQFYAETVHAARFSDMHLALAMLRRRALQLREEDLSTRRGSSHASDVSPVHAVVDWLRAARRR